MLSHDKNINFVFPRKLIVTENRTLPEIQDGVITSLIQEGEITGQLSPIQGGEGS